MKKPDLPDVLERAAPLDGMFTIHGGCAHKTTVVEPISLAMRVPKPEASA
jgi:hypothetical protein